MASEGSIPYNGLVARKEVIDSKDRILWIRGTLGVGKNILAGYFIDLSLSECSCSLFFLRKRSDRGDEGTGYCAHTCVSTYTI